MRFKKIGAANPANAWCVLIRGVAGVQIRGSFLGSRLEQSKAISDAQIRGSACLLTFDPQEGGVEEVDAAIREVNELLGEVEPAGEGKVPSGATATTVHKSLLCVERRLAVVAIASQSCECLFCAQVFEC